MNKRGNYEPNIFMYKNAAYIKEQRKNEYQRTGPAAGNQSQKHS